MIDFELEYRLPHAQRGMWWLPEGRRCRIVEGKEAKCMVTEDYLTMGGGYTTQYTDRVS